MSKKSKAETMKVLVTIPVPKDYSRRDVINYVRDAVHAHAGGFVEDSMIGESRKATARAVSAISTEHEARPTSCSHEASTAAITFALSMDSTEECTYFLRAWNAGEFDDLRKDYPEAPEDVYVGADPSHPETAPDAPATLTPVQVLNTFVRDINSIAHLPPVSLRQNRREYWKAGARACLHALNTALHKSAQEILGPGRPQPMDSELFNYWVAETSRSPYRAVSALAHCKSPDDYRVALWRMVKEDEDKALSSTALLNPEGGIA